MSVNYLLELEEELIKNEISSKFLDFQNDFLKTIDNQLIDEIKANLSDTENGVPVLVHNKLILNLIYTFLVSKGVPDTTYILLNIFENNGSEKFSIIDNIDVSNIPFLADELHTNFLNSKFEYQKGKFTRIKSKINLIEKGAVYTKSNIVKEIVNTTIDNADKNTSEFDKLKILDFACGTGRFYENIVSRLFEKYKIEPKNSVLNNVYAIDVDPVAVNITRLKALSFLDVINDDNTAIIKNNIILRNTLIRSDMFDADETINLKSNDFGGLINAQFDVIVSNPPYLVLKINRNKGNEELAQRIQNQVTYFRNSGVYHYAIEGMLNYYQLSIEAMLTMLKPKGELGVICPSSLFGDISSTKLRKYLLQNHKVRKIKYFAENEQLFENVTQATNIFYLQKSGQTTSIKVEEKNEKFSINFSLIKELFPSQMEIPFISQAEWDILKKMSKAKKLKHIPNVRNRRGELDLTLFKKFITKQKTPFRLVRGNMIGENEIKNINGEYVLEDFIEKKTDDFIKNDFKRKRLICQQISNAGQNKRLKFVFSDETDILGNSCNYISADENTLKKLYLLLNSNILNWRFKITSSNNHINNYELDELPIADLNLIDENFKYKSQAHLDEYVGKIYGLNTEEIKLVTQQ